MGRGVLVDQVEPREVDPFAPENASMLNFVLQARIYDVLIAILRESNADLAKQMLELHLNGKVLGPPPGWDGYFGTAPE
jgi:hypothetical protein